MSVAADVETREETKEEAGENNMKRGCVINHIPYALKGQKLLAQGNALGLYINNKVAL